MKEKMDNFINNLQEWVKSGKTTRKPMLNLTIEEVLGAAWFFVNYQELKAWVKHIEEGGDLTYDDYCFREWYKLNTGSYTGWRDFQENQ
ncbi:hypothetical protein [Deinococcus ficus]|uniref:hypothetical protein n=1 Tax=Deinococcus ficus TaxID=317577 RepID=UPI00131B3D3C|nr:hypothetical protein [Deinococcus ficus]